MNNMILESIKRLLNGDDSAKLTGTRVDGCDACKRKKIRKEKEREEQMKK